jgi:hypothetical protein
MKKMIVAACSLALLVSVGACKKKEEQPVPKAGLPGQQMMPPQGMPQQGMPPQGKFMMPKGDTVVTVPDAVKGKWKGVVLVVADKTSKKQIEITAGLHSEVKVPNTDLKIAVGDFMPDFRMMGLNITSASDEPNNPAVGVRVSEAGKQIFPTDPAKKWAWLYGKPELRNVHPFEHAKYAVFLKNGIKK